ncbi:MULTISPECIES: hypothetical protein [Limnospira]|jgi:hypothetical protein|uniref:Uncharacterized protein n=1 Tax=Limnospira platensis NIES-46 TaxID=1236695 RepID=A0A5M3T4I2_LIMPL|nr:hypothetical protein [Arthrospira platensis]MDF2210185.1 hypothetical protein [Arthrospira platensis NCB002]MDT9185037.1 hypothetical protein [Limnospira sp. PMC 289.06]MDT9295893.1 hypothetical protein [Arthrospira platensis PCC 7345]BAI89805.1 hypothetical protein NIES39_D03870 [Arthrospira platensis NIES-39]BDT12145.1 hypothetical protein N39L_18680 [Arthrospira platensis NIES-39]
MTEDSKCPHEEVKDILRRALKAKSARESKRLRREAMRMMMAAPEHCFWRGEPPQYRDDLLYVEAVAVAWDYIERKIHGNVRGGKVYDPDIDNAASPFTLWDIRCKGEYKNRLQQRRELIDDNPPKPDPETPYNIENEPQPSVDIPRLEGIRREIENDPTGELTSSFVRQTPPPPITVQDALLFIYDRVSKGEKYTLKLVAEHFKIPPGVVNGAWSRTISPLLKKMGDRLSQELDLDGDIYPYTSC